MSVSVYWEHVKRMDQALLHSAKKQDKRQKLMNRKSHLNMSRNFFTVGLPCTGTDCLEGLWSLPHWRCSRTVWTPSCAMCSAMAQLEQGGGST